MARGDASRNCAIAALLSLELDVCHMILMRPVAEYYMICRVNRNITHSLLTAVTWLWFFF